MALPRKGSRLIAVDGVVYRWTVRRKPTKAQAAGWRLLTFAVEVAESPGGTLSVVTKSVRLDSWYGLGRGPGMRAKPVTPRLVVWSVRQAIAAGWEPKRAGSNLTLEAEPSA